MKTTLRLLILTSAVTIASCGGEEAPEAITVPALEKKDTAEVVTVKVDTLVAQVDFSSIGWKCSKPLATHNGIIKISKGWIGLTDGKISQGAFTIDMKTIVDLDVKDAQKNKKFAEHLRSKDFFDVEVFPTSEFEVTSATDSTITGNFTLKGKANSITFPYKTIMKSDTSLIAIAKFSIDRSKWGIEFLGKSVAGIKPNDIVSDMIELDVSLSAAKK